MISQPLTQPRMNIAAYSWDSKGASTFGVKPKDYDCSIPRSIFWIEVIDSSIDHISRSSRYFPAIVHVAFQAMNHFEVSDVFEQNKSWIASTHPLGSRLCEITLTATTKYLLIAARKRPSVESDSHSETLGIARARSTNVLYFQFRRATPNSIDILSY